MLEWRIKHPQQPSVITKSRGALLVSLEGRVSRGHEANKRDIRRRGNMGQARRTPQPASAFPPCTWRAPLTPFKLWPLRPLGFLSVS